EVAVVRGSTAQDEVDQHMVRGVIPPVRVRPVEDYAAALAALEDGEVSAVLADDAILHGLMILRPHRFRLLPDRLTRQPYAVAVAPGDRGCLVPVNAGVGRFKVSGAWRTSFPTFVGGPAPAPPGLPPIPEPTAVPLARAAARARQPPAGALPLARRGTR